MQSSPAVHLGFFALRRAGFAAMVCAFQFACGDSGAPSLPGHDDPSECTSDTCEDCTEPSCFEQEESCRETGCPKGLDCLDTGVCGAADDELDVGDFPIVGGAGSGTGGASSCLDVQVDFVEVIPTVSLLIDRSSSMQGATGQFFIDVSKEISAGTYEPWGCPSDPTAPPDDPDQMNPEWRWNVVRNVLFHPESGVVASFDDQVRFAMTLFTHQPEVDANQCPELIQSEFALGNAQQLQKTMLCSDLGRFTPTRESLEVAAQQLHELDADGPKVIVLATDGSPTTCACTDFRQDPATPEECRPSTLVERGLRSLTPQEAASYDVVQEARRIHDDWGIQIAVINLSSEDQVDFRSHLEEVADAGGGELYDGLNPSGLSDAFFSSVEHARSCEIDLEGEIVDGFEDQGTVVMDGQVLPLATWGMDGYRVVSSSRIELLGEPCTLLKEGSHQLDISFPCDTFVVIR